MTVGIKRRCLTVAGDCVGNNDLSRLDDCPRRIVYLHLDCASIAKRLAAGWSGKPEDCVQNECPTNTSFHGSLLKCLLANKASRRGWRSRYSGKYHTTLPKHDGMACGGRCAWNEHREMKDSRER